MQKHYYKHLEFAKSLGVVDLQSNTDTLGHESDEESFYESQEALSKQENQNQSLKEPNQEYTSPNKSAQARQLTSSSAKAQINKQSDFFFISFEAKKNKSDSFEVFSEAESNLLDKILSSINQQSDQISFSSHYKNNLQSDPKQSTKNLWNEIEKAEPEILILLGSELHPIFHDQELTGYNNSSWESISIPTDHAKKAIKTITIPSLSEMLDNKENKKIAWKFLQEFKN